MLGFCYDTQQRRSQLMKYDHSNVGHFRDKDNLAPLYQGYFVKFI